jgi:hypothetical protein
MSTSYLLRNTLIGVVTSVLSAAIHIEPATTQDIEN